MTERRGLLFAVASVTLLLLNAATVRAWFQLATNDGTASHLLLIPFASLGLLLRRRAAFESTSFDAAAGVPVVMAGAVLIGCGRAFQTWLNADAISVATAGLLAIWLGMFLAFYGRRTLRAAGFPLLFLLFMIPIPTPLLSGATQVLKQGSAEAVAGLFTVTGTPYYRTGFVFQLATTAIEIADQCSGIRSSIALVLTTLLMGEVLFDAGWKKLVLVAVSIPLALLKNGIRIVSLTLLAMHVDPKFLTGSLHHEGGIVFYAIALALLMPVVHLLMRINLTAWSVGTSPTTIPE